MIITIDGPAGAGKSSVSRELARRLGFRFLDTGAMYRAVALAALEQGVDWSDAAEIEAIAQACRIEVSDDAIQLNGRDVSQAIRTPEVTAAIRYVADHPGVRGLMVDLQRRLGTRDTVTEGRDQGTVAFPHAECKIYLTASPEERARRRVQDLAARGTEASFDEILAQQNERDQRDSSRSVGRLMQTPDMIELVTDGLSPEQVVERLEQIVRARLRELSAKHDAPYGTLKQSSYHA
jgi:cytidylate kinase